MSEAKTINTEIERLLNSIDQSVLKPTTTKNTIIEEALIAKEKGFRAFVFHPCYINTVKDLLNGTLIKSAVVCDFPHGKGIPSSRINEVKEIIALGADEIDIVSKYHLLKEGDLEEYKKDLLAISKVTIGKKLKIILEVDLLTVEEIERSTQTISDIAAENHFNHLTVKTKTGFAENKISNTEASKIIINKLKELNNFGVDKVTVKASGGIKTKEDALKLLDLGVHYLGTSSGLEIIN